ncbi:Aspartic proteinase nepenthesin-1 [Acorus calamus]|uniref:Aspartic proteinase nepenthesin-1 n=1 Tax=Acorus calamus TaxID=4465 RepID=A0AAV9CAW1_ACOCL|nr:Aspartic proteinase nepenthesin-1 [Acorus calamus]
MFTSTANAVNASFSLTLIHRDSPLSPFHNPNLTRYELNQAKFGRAIAYEHALSAATALSSQNDSITPQLMPHRGEYLPCRKCYPQKDPIYDPAKSNPSMFFQCTDSLCNLPPRPSCGTDQECRYRQEYISGTFSEGELMRDEFAFEGPDSATASRIPIVFGCAHTNVVSSPRAWADGVRAGIAGMNRAPLSLVSQLDQPAFAYCLLGQPQQSMTTRVQIGTSPRMWGNSTQMLAGRNYAVLLEHISLGAQRVVDFPSGHMVMLDSGTTMTYLEPELFNPVLNMVKGLVKGFEVIRDSRGLSELCYRATTKELVEAGLPVIKLWFMGGARLEMNVESLFLEKDPIYDPSKSYTSKSFDCTNSTCNFTPGHSCSANNECAYHLAYLDGSFSDGVLMQEEFVFEGPDSATVKGVKLAFGCGRNNVFKGFSADGGNTAGVMGMGRGQLSLASQLAQPAFAYCLLGEADKSMTSRVQLGSSPRMWGNSTAIVRARGRESQYSVLLDGVSLGAARVIDIPTGQVVSLDSGASMTFLESSLFGPVIEAVRGAVKGFEVARDPRGLSELCYSATTKELVQAGLPVLELGFVGGSRLEVKAESLFLEVAERRVCITLIRSSFGQSIIGNIAQQNNVVGYDLAKDRIYMSGAYDCKLY